MVTMKFAYQQTQCVKKQSNDNTVLSKHIQKLEQYETKILVWARIFQELLLLL